MSMHKQRIPIVSLVLLYIQPKPSDHSPFPRGKHPGHPFSLICNITKKHLTNIIWSSNKHSNLLLDMFTTSNKRFSSDQMVSPARRWEDMNPEILSLIFTKIDQVDEMTRIVPFVCKPWMEVVMGPYCWSDVDIQAWCRRCNDGNKVDLVVKKLVRRSKCMMNKLSAYHLGETGLFYVAYCGKFLKVLQIPMSSITDQMVSKHIKPLPNLTTLDVSHCLKITSKGLVTFGNNCKSLVHLRRNMHPAEAFSPVDDSEAITIANTMPNLKHIDLCFGRFGDSGLSEIVSKCKSLTHLDIQGSWNVELHGDLEEICDQLEHFQSPWVDHDDDFGYTQGSDGDESEVDFGSD